MENIYLIIFAVIFLLLLAWIIILEIRLNKLLRGKDGVDLERTINSHTRDLQTLAEAEEMNAKEIEQLAQKFTKSIQGIGIVRFNPFRESGGNHSFSIALIDENSDGVVLSTLYARERTNVFAKPIKGGKSEIELNDEEVEALQKAQSRK